ncbi:MAG: CoA-transferase subunit beta [Candidatus Helarchaeota archaeon]
MVEFCKEYTGFEMMLVTAAREIRDGEVVFNAFQWPFLAVYMAFKLGRKIAMVFETGTCHDYMPRGKMPFSLVDPVIPPTATFIGDSLDSLGFLQRGDIDIALLATSIVDKYGNVNTTVIGDYDRPKIRLPGGGGATEIAVLAKRIIWLLDEHSKRRLVERVNYITDVGHLNGYDSRKKAGYTTSNGPEAIITPLCTLRFHPTTKEAYLDALHPGITIEEVKQRTGWNLQIAEKVKQNDPPTLQEIAVCRQTMKDAINQFYILKPEWTKYLVK